MYRSNGEALPVHKNLNLYQVQEVTYMPLAMSEEASTSPLFLWQQLGSNFIYSQEVVDSVFVYK